jgi:nanoRNase/pAp phosphatase (c-di-AMP/oligoRNAs hydrolase)
MNEKDKPVNFEKQSLELIKTIKKYPRLLIYIKGSPDPDAIGGAYVLKLLCDAHGTEGTIVSPQEASLPQNIKIIKGLRLPIRFKEVEDCKKYYDAYAVLDHQSVFAAGITGVIPCAIHIDHHEPSDEEIPVELQIQTGKAGSTSTLIIHLLKVMNVTFADSHWRSAATILYYGIQTDTDNFQHAGELDDQALEIISPYVDRTILTRINSLPFSKETMLFFRQALQNQMIYKDWLISGIGFINEKYRDNIGIIGDFLIKREGIEAVVVFGIVEKDNRLVLDASFRTKNENLNLNKLIKMITKEGGGRKYKGAFQVNLDYFVLCPDRDLLWKIVYSTTIETLKKSRDDTHATDLQKLYGFLKKELRGLFD